MRWLQHDWPDGSVVYDRDTGDTHAVDALGAEILQLPPAARQDPAAACEAIATLLQQPLDEALAAAVQESFSRLRQLELI
ncbi:MAG: HPr-rel-A system PqqD family peptide chaperone [Rhodocyclaceae bacterium]